MGTHSRGPNATPETCRNCGQHLNAGEGIAYEVWGYPWDGSDTEGSIMEQLDQYVLCVGATDCARRTVEQGTNLSALRAIAADYDNLGELAHQARAILRDWAELAREDACTADLVARENGYGVIGGPNWE